MPEVQIDRPPAQPAALTELRGDASSRKKFLRMLGGGGAAGALGVLLTACGKDNSRQDNGASRTAPVTQAPLPRGPGGDVIILNYALTLEHLEADFYRQVIDSGLIKDPKVASLAKHFGATEQEHVTTITAAVKKLGGTPVAAPRTKFQDTLAKGLDAVLMTAATVENLGAAAYLGQAIFIQDKEVLAAALSIHSVEARHAAALNQLVGRDFRGNADLEGSIPDGSFATPLLMPQVLAKIKPFIAS